MSWLTLVFKPKTLKRYISSALSVITQIMLSIPELVPYVYIVDWIAGLFGITGVVHSTAGGTISKAKLGYAASFVAFLITLAQFVPALEPYVPFLQKLAAILGAAGLGAVTAVKLSAKT